MNKFEELIIQLGEIVNVGLHAERGRICKLNINGVLHVHIEYDETKDMILLACFVADLPPGKFRENVLKEAMRINSTYPRLGSFAYSERNNKLAFFDYLSFTSLRADKLNDKLNMFIEKADEWRTSIDSGNLSLVTLPPSVSGGPPLGVKR